MKSYLEFNLLRHSCAPLPDDAVVVFRIDGAQSSEYGIMMMLLCLVHMILTEKEVIRPQLTRAQNSFELHLC